LIELRNGELYEQLICNIDESLTILNAIDRIQFLFSMNESCEREIEFCSSHLYELDMTSVFSMPIEIVSNIVSNKSIRLKDEESFSEIISSKQSQDSRFVDRFPDQFSTVVIPFNPNSPQDGII
jgi:hypothetical protein